MERAMANDTYGFRRAKIETPTAFEAWPATHVLCLGMVDPQAGLAALLSVLGATEARLESLMLKPRGELFEAVARMTGIGCDAACNVAAQLDGQDAVTSARI